MKKVPDGFFGWFDKVVADPLGAGVGGIGGMIIGELLVGLPNDCLRYWSGDIADLPMQLHKRFTNAAKTASLVFLSTAVGVATAGWFAAAGVADGCITTCASTGAVLGSMIGSSLAELVREPLN